MKTVSGAFWLRWLGVVLISAAVIGGAFWVMRDRYEHRLRQEIWAGTAPQPTVLASPSTGAMRTVLLLGDSRMAQWGLPDLRGWRVINAGRGGMTTAQIRLQTPRLLDEFHPNTVVVEAGINDLKYLGLRPALAPAIVALAASNLTAIVQECSLRPCGVIVLETWPTGSPGLLRRPVWNSVVPDSVSHLNAMLRQLDFPEKGIHVIDLFGKAGLRPGKSAYSDTLHFTPEIYERLTPVLERELNAAQKGQEKASGLVGGSGP